MKIIHRSGNQKTNNSPCIESHAIKPNFLKLVLAGTTNQKCEIGDNNDSGLSKRRNHECDILRKR